MPRHGTQRAKQAPAFAVAPATSGGTRVAGRIWVERDGETYLAWGRVVLLERIREHGSISGAARSMGMGYRHAWDLVDAMNRVAPAPLVARTTGGRGGGGTRLTPAGEQAIAEFWETVAAFQRLLAKLDPPGAQLEATVSGKAEDATSP